MSSNPSVSRALSLAGVTATLAVLAAGALLAPAKATAQDSREHGLTWETFVEAGASWALPDAWPPVGSVGSPQQASAGADVTDGYVFVLLPDLGLGMDINNQRQVVGLDTLNQGGVLIDDGVVTPIMVPGSVFTQPTNINEPGEIIGHFRPTRESPMMGFRRDLDGEFTTIVYPDPAAESTFLWGLNDQGDIVGDFRNEDVVTPFILDEHGDFAILDVPGEGNAVALGINNRGTISGWFVNEQGVSSGYLLEGNAVSVVEYPGAFQSDVGRVNNHGLLNGIHFTPPLSIGSFLRTEEGEFLDFAVPGFDITLMRGINDLGDQCGAVQVTFESPPQGFVGFRIDADLDGDGEVTVDDLIAVIVAWGDCPARPETCPADLDMDGSVGLSDLLLVVANWTT